MVRRIAVTLDAFEISAQALEQAIRLAERTGAKLEGIFVEDIDLITVSELPFLRELRPVSRSEIDVNLARMERELRALARRAERLLGERLPGTTKHGHFESGAARSTPSCSRPTSKPMCSPCHAWARP